jgi:hypothetical protein
MKERTGAYRVSAGKPDGKRPLGRPRRGWWDNSKIDFKGVCWKVVDWMDLAEVKDKWRIVVNAVLNLGIP